ncbi:MAG: phosphoserine phosphatase SerB [Deltaproteobacteria bacterium]|nr:phosphoserine phosphatase SerB [Deltaproteobacteria bacterium]
MTNAKDLLMVTVSGSDSPGITAAFSQVFLHYGVEVADIGQTSLQEMLGLYFLLDLSQSSGGQDSVLKELLFEANRLDLSIQFKLISKEDLGSLNQRRLIVLTHFGGTRALAEISTILGKSGVNIESISTLHLHGARSMEMILNVSGISSLSRLKQEIMLKSRELSVDLAIQRMEAYRKNKRLLFFDMDSTLVDMEVIDEMAREAGALREVARITERAMQGDFDFEESLRQRVAFLKGLSLKALSRIRDRMTLSEGVEELVTTLKWLGFKLGIVTGGFDFFAQHIKERLGFDFAFANHLDMKEGMLTGRISGPVMDAAAKARTVNQVSCDEGILPDQIVVVGDGANDALMLGQAGLGIAYNAKRALDRVATGSLGKTHLIHILHLLGITEEDVSEALSCKPSDTPY